MLTSLIEMLELKALATWQYNFSHVIKYCWSRVMYRLYEITTFFQNTFILRRPRVASFADIIKIAIIFIKESLKDSSKVKRIGNYVLKCDL